MADGSRWPGLTDITHEGHRSRVDPVHTTLSGHLPHAGIIGPSHHQFASDRLADEPGDRAMPGKVDEGKWNEAKTAAKKQYPDLNEENPRLWKIVSSIYKKMGGHFEHKVEKALAFMEQVERVTPTFVRDPQLWVKAMGKAGASLEDPTANITLTVKLYAEAGGRLQKAQEADERPSMLEMAAATIAASFEKGAAPHRYIEKHPAPGGGYSYKYPSGSGGPSSGAPRQEPTHAAPGTEPVHRQAESGVARAIANLARQGDQKAKAALATMSANNVAVVAEHAPKGSSLSKLAAQEMARRKGSTEKSMASEGRDGVPYDAFERLHLPEMVKALQMNHPGMEGLEAERQARTALRGMHGK